MDGKFLNQKGYKNETIKEQYFDGKELWVITQHERTGEYSLWYKDKKIGTSINANELQRKIKNY